MLLDRGEMWSRILKNGLGKKGIDKGKAIG
jgi:hypothetical protein